jgi:CRISPR-associated protein Csx17
LFYVAGSSTEGRITEFLAKEWQPTPYEKWWAADQKADTKAKASTRIWQARSTRPALQVRVADSTIIPVGRNQFNPLFGTGGNVGKRNMETAWREAADMHDNPNSRSWLEASLFGKQTTEMPPFTNGGTWFVYNNKTFNSGLDWYREGSLSPWSFLLAMEGALFVRGGSGRRLGAVSRPYAVFPFISQPLSPSANEDVGQKTAGEFWAPLWEQPATLGEVRALFLRGLARLGGRAATAPHEFAVAALAAGADAGVTHFVRFELRQTTSSQVYEALPRQTLAVRACTAGCATQPSALLEGFLGRRWFDKLPPEPARRDSKVRFSGLRGPLERLIIAVAREPENPEPWRELWLSLAATQARVDRNLNLRKRCRALPWLSWRWLGHAFPGTPPPGVRVAAALAALGSGTAYPAQCNVFGIEAPRSGPVFHQPGRPASAVWHGGEAQAVLLDFVQRRLTDSDKERKLAPLNSRLRLAQSDIAQFLTGDPAFMETVHGWLPALTLVDWTKAPRCLGEGPVLRGADPELLLWALFKPFFSPQETRNELSICGRRFFSEPAEAKPSFSRQLFFCLRRGAWTEALELAGVGYRAQGFPIVTPVVPSGLDAARVAAALALPVSADDLARLVIRWLEPHKQETKAMP